MPVVEAAQSPNIRNKLLSSISIPSLPTYLFSYFLNWVNGLTISWTKSSVRVSESCLHCRTQSHFSVLIFYHRPPPQPIHHPVLWFYLCLSNQAFPPVLSLKLPFDHTFIIFFLIIVNLLEFPSWACSFILFSLHEIFFHHLLPKNEVKLSPKLSSRVPFSVKSAVTHTLPQAELTAPLLVLLSFSPCAQVATLTPYCHRWSPKHSVLPSLPGTLRTRALPLLSFYLTH